MNSSNLKISDILEEVAAGYESGKFKGYSCCRILDVLSKHGLDWTEFENDLFKGLSKMGLETSSSDLFNDVEDKQKARMIWLTWAAMMAREQGL